MDLPEIEGIVPLEEVNGLRIFSDTQLADTKQALQWGEFSEEEAEELIHDQLAPDSITRGPVSILIDLNGLPKEVSRKIGVNLAALKLMCKTGGIGFIRINDSAKIKDDTNTLILGVSNTGEATAGFAKSRKKSSQNSSHQEQSALKELEVNTTIQIDSSNLASEITERSEQGFRSPEEWASLLNREVKSQILQY